MPSKKPTYKTKWDLTLLYKNEKDPLIFAHIKAIDERYSAFEKKYRNNTTYTQNEQELFEALKESEDMLGTLQFSAPLNYFYYRKDQNTKDKIATAYINKITEEMTRVMNKFIFFDLAVSKIPEPLQKQFLASDLLKPYRYLLQVLFAHGKHTLSESEEKILSLTSAPRHTMWTEGVQKAIYSQTVAFKGKAIGISEAVEKISTLPRKDRITLHTEVTKKMKSLSHFAESEINAVVSDKKIIDTLRGYEKPYSATILGYENHDKTIETLLSVVKKYNSLSHRFYKAKAKMLKLPHLLISDVNVSAQTAKTHYPFEKAVEIVSKVLNDLDPEYAEILNGFLKKGQIDVFQAKNKVGGAYNWSNTNAPTFVLLNYNHTQDAITTFAHEMGHAIHSELSTKHQRPVYRRYSTASAEVASTFFETLVAESLFATLPEKQKTQALHDRIQDDIVTIFRQVACFSFEQDLHTQIREKGALSAEEIAHLMAKNLKDYLGPSVKVTDDDGYVFVRWSHIRSFFYVYTYAFGKIISKALIAEYKKNPSFGQSVKTFLSAGGSATPEDIFKNIGIDITHPTFFKKGLEEIERDIVELEKRIKKGR